MRNEATRFWSTIADRGLDGCAPFGTSSRSGSPSTPPDVLLVDTTGELRSFYACADVIFVGKSLTEHGGQNIVEPALCGKPIIVGPNMENFAAVTQDFLAAAALLQVRDAADYGRHPDVVVRSGKTRCPLGEKAQKPCPRKSRGGPKNSRLGFSLGSMNDSLSFEGWI